MSTVVLDGEVRIPEHLTDLDAFCRWVCSEECPKEGRFSFLNGEVWVEMSPERITTHNQVKAEFTAVLVSLAKAGRLGRFYPDRALLRNDAAGLSTEPDGTFASRETLKQGRLRTVRGPEGMDILVGTPDMVLEIVSDTSERKDTVMLRRLYWEAGIPEFWLVDARTEPLRFDILRYAANGYDKVRKQAGWLKSQVFGKSFRLTVAPDEIGDPEYTLDVK